MPFFDSHCHLQDAKFNADRGAVLARARAVLSGCVVVGDDLENSRAAVRMAGGIYHASVGFHPYHAEQVDDAAIAALRELAAKPGVVAIGETGLDYHNEFAPREAQRKAFPRQLELAAELRLPVIVHCREAETDMLAILEEHIAALPDCILHCFGGDADFAERCLALGCYISFAGNVTFPKAEPLREAAARVPWERLLAETDAPYLAPQAHRGKRCEPAFVGHTVAMLAQVKGADPAIAERHTTENARRVYRIGARET